MIYIYDDGVHGTAHLQIAIQTLTDAEVRLCTASMILNNCLNQCRLLIMPGGADLYYCEKLNGDGNHLIRKFVNDGGSYLGICAGAYYGCHVLNWNHNEISGNRELAFYDGSAIGPIYEWVENKDDIYKGSWKHSATLDIGNNATIKTLYNGGPYFTEPEDDNSYVVARYADLPNTPPAIIGGTYGQGKYILSSPHLEKFGHFFSDGLYKLHNNSYLWENQVYKKLLPYEQQQKKYLIKILDNLI